MLISPFEEQLGLGTYPDEVGVFNNQFKNSGISVVGRRYDSSESPDVETGLRFIMGIGFKPEDLVFSQINEQYEESPRMTFRLSNGDVWAASVVRSLDDFSYDSSVIRLYALGLPINSLSVDLRNKSRLKFLEASTAECAFVFKAEYGNQKNSNEGGSMLFLGIYGNSDIFPEGVFNPYEDVNAHLVDTSIAANSELSGISNILVMSSL